MLKIEESSFIAELKKKVDKESYEKLIRIRCPEVHRFILEQIDICNPDDVFVCTDSEQDIGYIREEALKSGEERKLKIRGHTVHFDGYHDQARDRKNTKFLLSQQVAGINCIDREKGLQEIRKIMHNIMRGHRMYILFFSLAPLGSEFSIYAVQLTDSSYVAHSEHLLYRTAYNEFVKRGEKIKPFKFIHSAGELDERMNSKNIDERRVYIDLEKETVYSANTQYGGNTIGLKKLALRLAINRASKEGWLAEHMFIMGVHNKGRTTYFAGAFPSLCGKTSTSMLRGETIVGDDIAYLRRKGDRIRAVNPEKGIFGIIKGINPESDPILWKTLRTPGEIIFSNVLVTEGDDVYWTGMDGEIPEKGINYSGVWYRGKKDENGREVPPSHPNARFTLDMKLLENLDKNFDNPEGVVLGGIVYGGRDADTNVPVIQSFNWVHGVVTMGAALESETTAAIIEHDGSRKINPMSNIDFLSIPIGRYIENHIKFARGLKKPPLVFSVNYFLRDENGRYMNDIEDKAVWLKWMELRVNEEADALKTPIGYIPRYEELRSLFKRVISKEYYKRNYIEQFTIRVVKNLEKISRVESFYRGIEGVPTILFTVLNEQRERLKKAMREYGENISPTVFES